MKKYYMDHYCTIPRNHAVMYLEDKKPDDIVEETQRKLYQEPLESVGELDTTVDAWKEALDISSPNDPGFTIRELMEKFNIPRSTLLDRLAKLIVNKRCIRGAGTRADSRGHTFTCSVYQLIGEEK